MKKEEDVFGVVKETQESTERLYTKDEVKAKKVASGIGGTLFGAIATLIVSVIVNKATKINVTDKTTELADRGINKIKTLPQNFKKNEKEIEVSELD
jgi:hypothetical protein